MRYRIFTDNKDQGRHRYGNLLPADSTLSGGFRKLRHLSI